MSPPRSTIFPYTTLFRSLGLLDIAVARNAYGRQIASEVKWGATTLKEEPLEMVFIRAPIIERVGPGVERSEEHTSELQSLRHLVCRLLLEKKSDALTKH